MRRVSGPKPSSSPPPRASSVSAAAQPGRTRPSSASWPSASTAPPLAPTGVTRQAARSDRRPGSRASGSLHWRGVAPMIERTDAELEDLQRAVTTPRRSPPDELGRRRRRLGVLARSTTLTGSDGIGDPLPPALSPRRSDDDDAPRVPKRPVARPDASDRRRRRACAGQFRVTRAFADLTYPQHGPHDLDVGNGRVRPESCVGAWTRHRGPRSATTPAPPSSASTTAPAGAQLPPTWTASTSVSASSSPPAIASASSARRDGSTARTCTLISRSTAAGSNPWPLLNLEDDAMRFTITAEVSRAMAHRERRAVLHARRRAQAWADPVELVASAYESHSSAPTAAAAWSTTAARRCSCHACPLDPTDERIDSGAVHAAVR